MDTPNVLALTPGEPAGIGLDLAVLIAQEEPSVPILVYADPGLLAQRAVHLGLPLHLITMAAEWPGRPAAKGSLYIRPIQAPVEATPGMLDRRNSPYVLQSIEQATKDCLAGQVAALVTGPVHKGIVNEAGIPFSGHTEFLAKLTGGTPVMMLACPGLRVALATTHLPLNKVSNALSRESLTQVLRILHHDLRTKFGLEDPQIMVCGLNPHAGEDGHLGMEEKDVISPALERLRQDRGMRLIGPLPADSAFTPKNIARYDAVLAMYHDQGLPVLKHMGFGRSVNITLGLPIIRTSVDHGTALDLAGTGQADIGSLKAAIQQAIELVASRSLQARAVGVSD